MVSEENILDGATIRSWSIFDVSAGAPTAVINWGLYILNLSFLFYLQSGIGCEVSDSSPRPYNSAISFIFSTTFALIERSSGSVSCPKIIIKHQ